VQRAGKKFKRKKPKDQGEGYAARPSSEMGQSEGWNLLRVGSSDRNVQARERAEVCQQCSRRGLWLSVVG